MINRSIDGLVCPVTKQPLTLSEDRMATADNKISYRIDNGIPILLGPEAKTDLPWLRDVSAPQYQEAYSEMEFYNKTAYELAKQIRKSGTLGSFSHLGEIARRPPSERTAFPEPSSMWLTATVDVAAERDCYRHIGPVANKRVVQIGGSGIVAITLLLAGAAESVLLTPMLGEALVAREIASLLGLCDKLGCVVAIAEEIPLTSASFDVCFAGGCVHHMRTEIAFAEISRILVRGGKFAAIEPWRAPGYDIGTKLFGKREANAFCYPLTKERIAPFRDAFSSAEIALHGTLTRYPLIVGQKAGFALNVPRSEWVADIDDAICNCIPFARRLGSGAALLATK
jgi:uncharacterized protein YbaR (Trm112 family)/SAM-dependent methyltransferase